MRESIVELRSRLLELGCPVNRLDRLVREVADHREDLLRVLLVEGLTASEAEARADERLGDPRALAENLMESLRHSSWCGRHRFIAFGIMPVLAFPFVWLALLFISFSLAFALGFGWDEKKLHAAASDPAVFHHLTLVAYGADYLANTLVALAFCLLAGRAAAGRRWMLFVCLVCAAYSMFVYTYVSLHSITIGVNYHPQWIRAAIPLFIVGFIRVNRLRLAHKALNSSARLFPSA